MKKLISVFLAIVIFTLGATPLEALAKKGGFSSSYSSSSRKSSSYSSSSSSSARKKDYSSYSSKNVGSSYTSSNDYSSGSSSKRGGFNSSYTSSYDKSGSASNSAMYDSYKKQRAMDQYVASTQKKKDYSYKTDDSLSAQSTSAASSRSLNGSPSSLSYNSRNTPSYSDNKYTSPSYNKNERYSPPVQGNYNAPTSTYANNSRKYSPDVQSSGPSATSSLLYGMLGAALINSTTASADHSPEINKSLPQPNSGSTISPSNLTTPDSASSSVIGDSQPFQPSSPTVAQDSSKVSPEYSVTQKTGSVAISSNASEQKYSTQKAPQSSFGVVSFLFIVVFFIFGFAFVTALIRSTSSNSSSKKSNYSLKD